MRLNSLKIINILPINYHMIDQILFIIFWNHFVKEFRIGISIPNSFILCPLSPLSYFNIIKIKYFFLRLNSSSYSVQIKSLWSLISSNCLTLDSKRDFWSRAKLVMLRFQSFILRCKCPNFSFHHRALSSFPKYTSCHQLSTNSLKLVISNHNFLNLKWKGRIKSTILISKINGAWSEKSLDK
jgi:hypothetical protein